MQRVTRLRALLPACLAALILTGAVRAQDDRPATGPLDRKTLDGLIYSNLKDVINHGANLYNSGDWNGCYRLWEGTLMGLKPLLAHRPQLQKAIDTGIASAQQDPMLYRRAFVLRTVLDEVRTDLKGNAPKKETTAGGPTVPDKGKTPDKPKTEKTTDAPKKKSLWDRLGGQPGVTRLVDDFVNAAVADPKVDFFRHGKNKLDATQVARMKRDFVEWVSDKTGGPLRYDGPDMKKVHQGMGITAEQYDAMVGHIKSALQKNKVSDQDTATILAAVNSYRKDIVAPAKPEDKKPEDKKPTDKKPEDKKPVDKKPADKKPADKKEDKKPADKKPEDKKPADKKPEDKKTATPPAAEKKVEATGSLKGHVTYKGKPLPAGNIIFTDKDGQKISAALAADGTYSVARIKPGDYKLAIEVPVQRAAVGAKPADPKAAPAGASLPAKYADPKTSGLNVRVAEGEQTLNLNLQ